MIGYIYTGDAPDKEEGFFEILKHNMKHDKVLITMEYEEKNGTNWYNERRYWSNLSVKQIGALGYKKADGMFESLKYSFTPCYAKLSGFKEAAPTD